MEKHFNENYVESDKYPHCTFRGKLSSTDLMEGENNVTVSGTMNLHGKSRDMSVDGTIFKSGNWYKARAVFIIKLKDYGIKIPKAVFYNIAEEVEITVTFEYVPK